MEHDELRAFSIALCQRYGESRTRYSGCHVSVNLDADCVAPHLYCKHCHNKNAAVNAISVLQSMIGRIAESPQRAQVIFAFWNDTAEPSADVCRIDFFCQLRSSYRDTDRAATADAQVTYENLENIRRALVPDALTLSLLSRASDSQSDELRQTGLSQTTALDAFEDFANVSAAVPDPTPNYLKRLDLSLREIEVHIYPRRLVDIFNFYRYWPENCCAFGIHVISPDDRGCFLQMLEAAHSLLETSMDEIKLTILKGGVFRKKVSRIYFGVTYFILLLVNKHQPPDEPAANTQYREILSFVNSALKKLSSLLAPSV